MDHHVWEYRSRDPEHEYLDVGHKADDGMCRSWVLGSVLDLEVQVCFQVVLEKVVETLVLEVVDLAGLVLSNCHGALELLQVVPWVGYLRDCGHLGEMVYFSMV